MGQPGKTEMECGGKCGMVTLIVINIVFFLLGLALLIMGILFFVNSDVFYEDDVMEVLNDVNFSGSINLGDVVQNLPIFSIALGALILLISCLGACGACCKNRSVLIMYMCICILIVIAQCVCLALWGTLRRTIDDETTTKAELTAVLVKYKGYDNNAVKHKKSKGWNLIFIDLECCGVDTVSVSNDEFLASEWARNRGSKRIPVSCCKSATRANYKTHTDTDCTDAYTDYNTKGCYEATDEVIKTYDKIAIAVCAVLIMVEIIAIVAACLMCRALKSRGRLV